MDDPTALFGRLHPLVLHLPIGMVVALALLEVGALFARVELVRRAEQVRVDTGAAAGNSELRSVHCVPPAVGQAHDPGHDLVAELQRRLDAADPRAHRDPLRGGDAEALDDAPRAVAAALAGDPQPGGALDAALFYMAAPSEIWW